MAPTIMPEASMFIIIIPLLYRRIEANRKFINTAMKARNYHEALANNYDEAALLKCQELIDQYRHIPVFGINHMHKMMAKKFSKLYSQIQ